MPKRSPIAPPPVKLRSRPRPPAWALPAVLAGLLATSVLLATGKNSRPPTQPSPPASTPNVQTSPVDGMALIFIPAGPFPMGSDQGDPDEKPVHIVTLSDYWIDQTEVTNAMYARCVQAGVCQPPRKTASATRSDYYDNTLYANYPMLQVKWEMASRYCAWARRRLPSEAEWEKAARGPDGRTYPWGEAAPDATRLNFNNLLGDTAPVASYPLTGASPYAIHDLAGNAWEWVNDYYDPNYYQASPASNPPGPTQGSTRILRGGSWNNYGYYVRAASRSAAAPDDLDGTGYGFRCASTQP